MTVRLPDPIRLLLTVTLAAMLCGCSPLKTISAVSPSAGERETDIVFSARKDLKLDVYLSGTTEAFSNEPNPVIIFFYGGGWENGSREKYRFAASELTKLGYVVVIPDYRKYPEILFPAFIEDAAEAVNWVSREIEKYNGDPNNIFLAGHSAGAQIAAILHYDETWFAKQPNINKACGFIGLSGPYDFLPLVSPTLKSVFPEERRAASQPINFVDGGEGPALFIHGLRDKTVKPGNSASMTQKVNAAGGEATLMNYPKAKHAAVVLALASPLTYLAPVAADIDNFVRDKRCIEPE